jgi:integrase
MNWEARDEFVEKMFRRSGSVYSRRYYGFGVDNFRKFCEGAGIGEVDGKNVYSVMDAYVGYLHGTKGLKAKTIHDYITAVRKFLGYVDVEVDPLKFRNKVVMPKVTQIADVPLRLEDVQTLLTRGRPSPKLRALILVLLSSGMRIGEALSMRWADLDLNSTPGTIGLRAEYTKTRAARTAYVSEEAKQALLELKASSPPTERVLDYAGDMWQKQKEAGRTFRRLVGRVGLGERLEGHRTHRIHFHSFRKFFLTRAVDTLGDHAGHALCGHGFYMDTYYRKSEEERKAEYLRLMPRLTVFSKEAVSTDQMLATFNRQFLKISRYTDKEIEALGDLSQLSNEQLQDLIARKQLEKLGLSNGNRQKVIKLDELESYIGDGWEFVTNLNGDKAIVRLPSH